MHENAVLSSPVLHSACQEFRADVSGQLAYLTVDRTPLLEHGNNEHPRQRQIHFSGERRTFTLVQEVEQAIGAPCLERVAHHIHRPRVVQSRRRRKRKHLAFRQPLLRPPHLVRSQRSVDAVDALVMSGVPRCPQTNEAHPEVPESTLSHDRFEDRDNGPIRFGLHRHIGDGLCSIERAPR